MKRTKIMEQKPTSKSAVTIDATGSTKKDEGIVKFCGNQLELGELVLDIASGYYEHICNNEEMRELFLNKLFNVFDVEILPYEDDFYEDEYEETERPYGLLS